MCGRTVCQIDGQTLRQRCRYRDRRGDVCTPEWKSPPGHQQYYPSYNVAPGAHTPVIYSTKDCHHQRVIQPMQWGLIPAWHRGSHKDFCYKMNNCRGESMLTTASFKIPLHKGQRCVVVVDGFYEWKRDDSSSKQPYYIYMPKDSKKDTTEVKEETTVKPEITTTNEETVQVDDNCGYLMHMAGLYEKWTSPQGEMIYSYSVITVESSAPLSFIHHRMPAILVSSEDVNTWLDTDIPITKAVSVIRPTDIPSFHPVSSAVGNSRHNSPDCIVEIDLKKPKVKLTAGASFMQKWLKKADLKTNVGNDDACKTTRTDDDEIMVGVKRSLESGNESCGKVVKREPD